MPPKHSLGKGLGAMFPDLLNNIGDKPAFILCGIEELTPNRFQPRRAFNDADQQRARGLREEERNHSADRRAKIGERL